MLEWATRRDLVAPVANMLAAAVQAPPTDGELPNLDQVRAFLFHGDAGLSMHIGTWYEFPFALVDGA